MEVEMTYRQNFCVELSANLGLFLVLYAAITTAPKWMEPTWMYILNLLGG
jgi:hypothetical protein